MKKQQMIAALLAKGVEVSEKNTLAELRALCVENGIDPSEAVAGDEPPVPPTKERIMWFRVGDNTLKAASGVCAPRSRVRLKESDARLHEERGMGQILGYVS